MVLKGSATLRKIENRILTLLSVLTIVFYAFSAMLLGAKPKALADSLITEYSTAGYAAYHFTSAADGSLVFIKRGSNGFGSITAAGAVNGNAYSDPYQSSPQSLSGLTTGPDGNFWFTDGGNSDIYRLMPSGSVTQFPISTPGYGASDITTGPDGNLWFIEQGGDNIGSITTDGVSTIYPLPPYTNPISIAAGSDGALWYTTDPPGVPTIGRVTTSGTTNSWSVPSGLYTGSIAAGSDGAMWFTVPSANKIDRINSSGNITEFTVPTPNSGLDDIVAGSDGNLWFTESNGNNIGRITTSGAITEYPIPTPSSEPESIAVGSDGNIWFSETSAEQIGRLTLQGAPGITSPSSATATAGSYFNFTITTSGYPVATIFKSGRLPANVKFTDNGDGTATINGIPASISDGIYNLTITANNGIDPNASQNFTLTVNKYPVLHAIENKTMTVGTPFSMDISSSAYPTPVLTETGALPDGISFTDNGDGTATISGAAQLGSGGQYPVTITSTDFLGSTSQSFNLNVDEAPVITSGNTVTAYIGVAFNFQATATGYPVPHLTKSGTLPAGLTWHVSTGIISGTPTSSSVGTYTITFTATNSQGTVTQTFTLLVN